jgi:hypothetical protein
MNKSIYLIGIIVVAVLVVGGVIFWSTNKNIGSTTTKLTSGVKTSPIPTPSLEQTTQVSVAPTQKISITTTITPSPSQYSAEFRAKARSTFMANCIAKFGQQYASACTCGADYLAAHYTDTQLTKIYLEYHSSSQIPKEVQAAYNVCNKP